MEKTSIKILKSECFYEEKNRTTYMRFFTISFVLLALQFAVSAQTANDSINTAQQDSIPLSISLDSVEVTAQRQLIRQSIDRVSYDVQADNDAKTQTVMDMLRKVPMVTIGRDENILVKGNSNYKIYKNGHLDPNLTKNAKEIFKAMPASAIKRIEVITDPGAREDAEGVNAILNIVMMDTRHMDGITGNVNAGYTSLNHTNIGGYFATQFGKLNLSVNYGYSHMSKRETKLDSYIHRRYVESGKTEDIANKGTNPGNVHFADINASYDIDSLNLLSASFGGYFCKQDIQGLADSEIFDGEGNLIYSYRENYWLPDYGHQSWNGRFDYEHRTKRDGEKLTLSYMLALTRQHSDQETNYSNMVNFPFPYMGFLTKAREHFTEHTFQVDYVRPFMQWNKIEFGAKYIDRSNMSKHRQDFYQEPNFPSYSTDFKHTTHIAAVYADYIYDHDRWSARAGLRYEYSYMLGNYPDGSGQSFHKHLNDFVPQASIQYQIDERQSLKLGYITSITRPGITYLNPAIVTTPMRVDFGNPQLASARDQRLQLTYLYVGQNLTLQVVPQFNFSNDQIGSVVYAKDDMRYGTYGNVIKNRRFQIETYLQWKPFSKTTLVANLDYSHAIQKNTNLNMELTCNPLYYYVNVNQKLPWKLNISAYVFGQIGHAHENIYSYSRSLHRCGFNLQRSFLSDDRLTVRLTVNAPFNKNLHYYTRTVQGDILGYEDTINSQNNRQFQISVSFRFGKLKSRVKKTETTIENDDVVGGITRRN